MGRLINIFVANPTIALYEHCSYHSVCPVYPPQNILDIFYIYNSLL